MTPIQSTSLVFLLRPFSLGFFFFSTTSGEKNVTLLSATTMSIVATASPGSQRMSSNTYQFTPPHNPSVLPQSPRSPVRNPTFPLLYSNHAANSSVPSLYSPATVRYSFYPPTKHGRTSPQDQQPMQVFTNRLPDEVYECILSHLWSLHIGSCTEGCLTCYMRDLYSLSLTDRAWEKAVRGKL